MSEIGRRIVIGVLCVLAAGFAYVTQFTHMLHDRPDPPSFERVADDGDAEWDYVIPAGTADRIADGETVDVVPRLIQAEVGQTIRIENRDTEGQTLGPWYVGPGETMTQRFASEGVFEGECQVHESGEIRVEVTT